MKPNQQRVRSETINLRMSSNDRALIDQAAKAQGKTRAAFIREAARRAAEDALLDRAFVSVDPATYAAFLARLDAPPQPNERLKKTMQPLAPWERSDQ